MGVFSKDGCRIYFVALILQCEDDPLSQFRYQNFFLVLRLLATSALFASGGRRCAREACKGKGLYGALNRLLEKKNTII